VILRGHSASTSCRTCLNARFDAPYDWSRITSADLAYTAGMVDGEGHIGLAPNKSSFVPILIVTNTDQRIIDWLFERFSGAIHHHDRNNALHKARHNWRLQGKHATRLLELLLPYLVLKRKQAEIAISFYAPGVSFHDGPRRIPGSELERRTSLHRDLKELNKRGPTSHN
jgi:hypothetical protein